MSAAVKQSEQIKKDAFDYEDIVSEVEEVAALAYFVYEAQNDDYLDGKAMRGIYHQLERLSKEVKEFFNLACNIQRELDQIKRGKK